jgi:hypothetical protein
VIDTFGDQHMKQGAVIPLKSQVGSQGKILFSPHMISSVNNPPIFRCPIPPFPLSNQVNSS